MTFLFTDITGSMARWERHPVQMREALSRHNSILLRCFQDRGGFVFNTMGDSFCVAFSNATEGLLAAVEAQAALAAESWIGIAPISVRMALYTGDADYDGDYVGIPVNRVARLLQCGHGGQIVASSSTVDRIDRSALGEVRLHDLGFHWLEDFPTRERVFQVEHPSLPSDFPPIRSLAKQPNNLPAAVTSFVGRRKEIADVHQLLRESRHVTLIGAGGCGKTRLALEVARGLLGDFEHGVWLVELGSVLSGAGLPQAIADSTGLSHQGPPATLDEVCARIGDLRMLLVLDTCEHLVEDVAQTCVTLLANCPGVRILATSRHPLQFTGESVSYVPALSHPSPSLVRGRADLKGSEAIDLFRQRARALRPSFEITDANAVAVARICQQLDGIPLAIELAAARIRNLSVDQIADRLADRFALLQSADVTRPSRQQTLRATLDWSYGILDEASKTLFRRLAAFKGSFESRAVESVCEGPPITRGGVHDLLWTLVDSSLVLHDDALDRFSMLQSVESYARQALAESDEEAAVRARHAEHFRALAEEATPNLQGDRQKEWMDRLEADHDNLRAALEWTIESETGLRIAVAIHRFWLFRGHIREGRSWLERALSHSTQAEPLLVAKAHNAQGVLAWSLGEILNARDHFAKSLEIAEEIGDLRQAAALLTNMGVVSSELRDFEAADACYVKSMRIYSEAGDLAKQAAVQLNLGSMRIDRGDYDAAEGPIREALEAFERIGDRVGASTALSNIGWLSMLRGDLGEARSILLESLRIRHEVGDKRGLALTLSNLTALASRMGDHAACVEFAGACETALTEADSALPPSARQVLETGSAQALDALGETAFQAALQVARSRSLGEAVDRALRWQGRRA